MLFVEPRFFLFFLIVFAVHWTLRNNSARKTWLLATSYFFYTCFFNGPGIFHGQMQKGWWFPLMLFGSSCMDYLVGIKIEDSRRPGAKRAWLAGSMLVNAGVLVFFKYFNFFIVSAAQFLQWLGIPASPHTLAIILPYGVSFYTFQSMSYTIEIYRGHLKAVRRPLDLFFFISFFPQLVAGPIVRAMTFLPQVSVTRRWSDVDARGALVLFMMGFVKKACVAEMVAPSVDAYFAAPDQYNSLSAWIAVLLYAVQIYCDFSGYTDMAIATARLLGYELTVNFNFPYFATSISDFWRRWHMSLSTWLRDYLYISLGGNRGSRFFTSRNLMLTMILGGLWHGANWTFVIWGTIHGAALILHREWAALTVRASMLRRVMTALCVPLTFYWICVTWIFFRARDFGQATAVLNSFVLFDSPGAQSLHPILLLLFAGLALVHWMNYRGIIREWWRKLPEPIFAAGYGSTAAVILLFVPTQSKPFIYFQF